MNETMFEVKSIEAIQLLLTTQEMNLFRPKTMNITCKKLTSLQTYIDVHSYFLKCLFLSSVLVINSHCKQWNSNHNVTKYHSQPPYKNGNQEKDTVLWTGYSMEKFSQIWTVWAANTQHFCGRKYNDNFFFTNTIVRYNFFWKGKKLH